MPTSITFPGSPSVDDTYTYGAVTYIWDGTRWYVSLSDTKLTTKGDILGYGTTSVRIEVGTNGQVLTADSTDAEGIKWDNLPTAGSNTGVALSLTNINGIYYNMSAANAGTTYTTAGTTLGAFCVSRINSATEPVVTGGTKIAGATFAASTDMHLWVQYFGATVQFWFAEL